MNAKDLGDPRRDLLKQILLTPEEIAGALQKDPANIYMVPSAILVRAAATKVVREVRNMWINEDNDDRFLEKLGSLIKELEDGGKD